MYIYTYITIYMYDSLQRIGSTTPTVSCEVTPYMALTLHFFFYHFYYSINLLAYAMQHSILKFTFLGGCNKDDLIYNFSFILYNFITNNHYKNDGHITTTMRRHNKKYTTPMWIELIIYL